MPKNKITEDMRLPDLVVLAEAAGMEVDLYKDPAKLFEELKKALSK